MLAIGFKPLTNDEQLYLRLLELGECMLLVSNFHGNRLNGLRVIVVRSWSLEMLILWNFWTDLGNYFV